MSKHDPVNRPSHYTQGGLEPIEAIEAWKLNFNLGNAVKYIARAGKKDPSKLVEDLSKGRWYLNREIASHVADEYNDESGETIIEAAERISLATGYDHHTVISTALWLYQEAIDAKRAGKHVGVALMTGLLETEWHGLFEGDDYDGEEEESEPLPDDFEPNEETRKAIHDVDAGIGVTRHETAEDAIDAAMRDDDESKTFSASRCANCGMPIVFEPCVKACTGLSDGSVVDLHAKCLNSWRCSMKPEPEKPKFATGDVVRHVDSGATLVVYGKCVESGQKCLKVLSASDGATLILREDQVEHAND